ncbi:hypothetical protein [Pseudobacteroides cellulosolvens]|uniref:Uncharacterized protein n=1 Tax=Pseudobacteroides cellulosolvens ATCC 35603 = DSM 2933 TaxID=398512 RepID=A0A0L6JWH7_9FIRM|nr:hypothetical protein [Pseudobacteroides cellulosolvens]KNY29782.1 hypothetical protein Bccel_5059 [Pseudobacteroides cellulosolvens ATCC 35603 = DSM 2933]
MKKSKKKSSKMKSFKGIKPVIIFSGIFIAIFTGSLILYFISDKNSAGVNNQTIDSSPSNSIEVNSSPANKSSVPNSTPVPQQATSQIVNTAQISAEPSNKDNSKLDNQQSNQNNAQQDNQDKINWKQKVDKLPTEGFKIEEIDSSKQYVQGVVSNLNQIVSFSSSGSILPQPGISQDSSNDDSSKYQDLSAKIDMDKAIYHMVKIKSTLGSKEKVFDEYLLTLQLDLDISELSKDKASYEKKKNEKLISIDQNSLITADSITQKMLESIQNQNEKNRNSITNPNQNNSNSLPGLNNPSNNLPGIQVPNVPDPEADIRNKLAH